FLGHRRGADGEIHDRAAVDVDALDLRLLNAFRQVAAYFRHRIAHVGDGPVDRRADLEFDADVRLAFHRGRLDVLHPDDIRNGALDLLDDLRLDLWWRGAGLRYADDDVGERDIRVLIDRQPDEGHEAHEEQHDEQHHRRDGMLDGPRRNIFHGAAT